MIRVELINSLKFFRTLLAIYLLCFSTGDCARKRKPALQSDLIEEVDAKKLESYLEEEEYLAVFFCK